MARLPLERRKRRTREHIIADLSVNHVERQILRCGYSAERPLHDYGVDLLLFTYNNDGEPEPGEIWFQLKATDRLTKAENGQYATIRIERAHLRTWLAQATPVILVVYDASRDRAYWLHVQAEFGGVRRFEASRGSETLTVRIPIRQVLNPNAIQRFRTLLGKVMNRREGTLYADE